MPNLIQIIKQAAMEAVEASSPTKILFGTVVTTSPLSIKIDQKFTIPEEFLVLTRNVMDYTIEMTVDHVTEKEEEHSHAYKGKKKFTIHNGLKIGDKVILLQEQGGQKYVVLDKVGD